MAIIKHHHLLLHLLQACSKDPSLKITRSLHALTITMGPVPNQAIFVHNNLMSQYTSIGMLSMARNLFDEMPHRNVVSYNTMISGYGRLGFVKEAWDLFSEMRNCGFEPTQFTFGGLLSVELLDVWQGAQLQGLSVKNGLFHSGAIVGTALLGLYGRDGCFEEALRVLEDMCWKSLVTWNSILSLLGRNQLVDECKLMFCELMCEGMELSKFSFVGVLSCFSREEDLKFGQLLHGIVIKIGFYYEVLVVNSLLNMYLQCGGFFFADKLFEEVPVRDVVTYNSIIAVGTKVNRPEIALELFYSMAANGLTPTQASFVNAVNSCSCLGSSIYGEYFHSKTVRYALESDVFVGTALIDFYAKFKKLEEAHHCFDEIAEKNVVSWNALILEACAKMNEYFKVLELFKCMLVHQIYPDNYTFTSLLSVCAKLCNLALGSSIHGVMIKNGSGYCDTFVCNLLIDMYGKCGSIECALKIFDEVKGRNLITWTVLISVLGLHGHAYEAMKRFAEMELLGLKPDRVALIAVLTACKHGGLVEEGMELFSKMKVKYGVEPEMNHYQCVVDLLSSHGHVVEAEKVIASMPFPPDALLWRIFLEGCKRQRTL
uniref:Pentatricopeptide repeat-containing protein At3g58590 n=1 Tax=Cucumis melo TaxID=3656 RepID=A0A9I9DKA3_CUCME